MMEKFKMVTKPWFYNPKWFAKLKRFIRYRIFRQRGYLVGTEDELSQAMADEMLAQSFDRALEDIKDVRKMLEEQQKPG